MWGRTHWLSFFWLAPSSFSLVKITFPPLSSGEEMIMGSICVCKVRVWAQVQRKLARRKCRHIASHSTWQQHELRTSKDAVAQWLFCTSTNGTISFFAGLTFTKANIHLLNSVMPWKNQQKCKGQRFLLFLWDLARFFPFFSPQLWNAAITEWETFTPPDVTEGEAVTLTLPLFSLQNVS